MPAPLSCPLAPCTLHCTSPVFFSVSSPWQRVVHQSVHCPAARTTVLSHSAGKEREQCRTTVPLSPLASLSCLLPVSITRQYYPIGSSLTCASAATNSKGTDAQSDLLLLFVLSLCLSFTAPSYHQYCALSHRLTESSPKTDPLLCAVLRVILSFLSLCGTVFSLATSVITSVHVPLCLLPTVHCTPDH